MTDSHLPPAMRDAPWGIAVAHSQPLLAAGLSHVLLEWGHRLLPWPGAASRPDLLLADGSTAAAALSQPAPGLGVLAIEACWRAGAARDLLAAGASACLQAGCTLDQLAEALASARAGRRYLCPTVSALLVDDVCPVALTPREREVLRLLCEGLDNKTIGQRLGLALTTVKSHVQALLAKSAARSRTEMAALALRSGWV